MGTGQQREWNRDRERGREYDSTASYNGYAFLGQGSECETRVCC